MSQVVVSNRSSQVIEPELDMNRRPPRVTGGLFRVRELLRWLLPEGRLVGPPMRSIARELEEAFPSRDH